MTPSPRTMGEAKEQATQADSRTSWNPPREGRRTHLLDTWMNISARTLGAVPSHRMAKRLLELGVIDHERFLELVEHLDHLTHSRIEKTHRPQQDLRCRLDACRLANFLENHLHELTCCERLGAG